MLLVVVVDKLPSFGGLVVVEVVNRTEHRWGCRSNHEETVSSKVTNIPNGRACTAPWHSGWVNYNIACRQRRQPNQQQHQASPAVLQLKQSVHQHCQNDGLIIVFVGGIHRCTKRAPAAAPLCRRPRGCCSPAPTPPLVYHHEAKNITPAASLKQFQRLYVSIRSHPPVCCHHHHHQRSQPLPPQLPRINVPKRLSGRSVDDSRCLHRNCML